VVFSPISVNPMATQAKIWRPSDPMHEFTDVGKQTDCVGHGHLAVIGGERLSTNGSQIFKNGHDITPEPFNGPVWDDAQHYGYKQGWDGGGAFLVRRYSDNAAIRQILPPVSIEDRPYTTSVGLFITGIANGRGYVDTPFGVRITTPEKELCGPVFENAGVVYIVTAVMGRENNPRGVMVRPVDSLYSALGTPSLLGWYVDGIRHQFLQARTRPGNFAVVGGAEFPGTGVITVDLVDLQKEMTLVPVEPIVVDPPKPDPPDPPKPDPPKLPDPKMLISPESGTGPAPFELGASAHYLSPINPVVFLVKRTEEANWRVASVAQPTNDPTVFPTHLYKFPEAGSFQVMATGGGQGTGVHMVSVTAPPPPTPTKPWWMPLWLWKIVRS